jgi:hypothetical protein
MTVDKQTSETLKMRERSGTVKSRSNLVAFFYELLKDMPSGTVETLVRNSDYDTEWTFTNGWLARYAKDIVKRLSMTDKERELLEYVNNLLETAPIKNGEGSTRFDAVALIQRLRFP